VRAIATLILLSASACRSAPELPAPEPTHPASPAAAEAPPPAFRGPESHLLTPTAGGTPHAAAPMNEERPR
jgi:hypothetical protein